MSALPLRRLRSRRTLLLVDDDGDFRRETTQLLRREGFRCFEADSGPEALEVLELIVPGRLELVLIDLVLPGMNGIELSQEIARRSPDLPFLFLSSHPPEVLLQFGMSPSGIPFLRKPFSRDDLMAAVTPCLR